MVRLHVATVFGGSGVRFVAVGSNQNEVDRKLAMYIKEQADHVLWLADRDRVCALLDAGRLNQAISVFFRSVGDRWDSESLHRQVVDVEDRARKAGFGESSLLPSASGRQCRT